MKRVIIILLLLLCFITSCAQQKKIPTFEDFPLTLSGTLAYNGTSVALSAVLKSKSSCDISIASPESLTGYSFKVDNSEVWVYYDNMQIELKNGGIDIPFSLLPKMLSVSREDFEYSRTDEENLIYYYKKDGTDTVVYVKRGEEFPCRIEYTKDNVNITLDIESFAIQ